MDDAYYGLSCRPFQLTPDPKFWFDTATHKKAMAYLGYGLSQGEGFIVITGDPGAGKTTLVGHLMSTIDRERLNVIRIVTTQVDPSDLLHMVAAGLDVDTAGLPKAQILAAIERGLHAVARGGRRTLLIVDEAQGLPATSLEELRMLSNFQAGGYPLLQIFLLGQPEFRERLQDRRLEQLRQRVIAMHHLDPMGADELRAYLAHRLQLAGWQGRPVLRDGAIHAMHRWSHGLPRRVNQLASRVLLFGAVEEIDEIEAVDVETVIADLEGDTPQSAVYAPMATPERVAIEAVEPDPQPEWVSGPDPASVPEPEPVFAAAAVIEPLRPTLPEVAPWEIEEDDAPTDRHEDAADEESEWLRPSLAPMMPIAESPMSMTLSYQDDGFEDEDLVEAEVAPEVEAEAEAGVEDAPGDAPDADPASVADLAGEHEHERSYAPPAGDLSALMQRVESLEARLEEQDVALRRVLTLLVDWVEDGARPDLGSLRSDAA